MIYVRCLCSKRVKSIITREKDELNTLDEVNGVYKFNCKQCPDVYNGETKQALNVLKGEHKNNNNADAIINVHRNS